MLGCIQQALGKSRPASEAEYQAELYVPVAYRQLEQRQERKACYGRDAPTILPRDVRLSVPALVYVCLCAAQDMYMPQEMPRSLIMLDERQF